MQTITFDSSAKNFILQAFNKAVNDEGLIVEKNNPAQKVLSPDGQEISVKEFAGVKRGSEIFIKSDLLSLLKLCDASR
jgi:hypothetical protein